MNRIMSYRRTYAPLNIDEQSEESTRNREYDDDVAGVQKSVCLAIFLLIMGLIFFILSILHASGHIVNNNGAGYGFAVLGLLTFLPGFYHSRLAYYAWRGYRGYSFKSIPSF